jgi:hypothetical protein
LIEAGREVDRSGQGRLTREAQGRFIKKAGRGVDNRDMGKGRRKRTEV